MRRQLLFVMVLACATIPAAALISAGSFARADALARSRAALSDVTLDHPDGWIGDYGKILDSLRSMPSVDSSTPVLSGPVVLSVGTKVATARLVGVERNDGNINSLDTLVTKGSARSLRESHKTIALAAKIAEQLGVDIGDEILVRALEPGPEALGSRKRTAKVSALLHSGLSGFDTTAAVAPIPLARELLAPGPRIGGIRVSLDNPAQASQLDRSALPEGFRVREMDQRDLFSEMESSLPVGKSLVVLVFLLSLLAYPLAFSRLDLPFGGQLRVLFPWALLALGLGCGGGLALGSLVQSWAPSQQFVQDIGRIVFALLFGVALSPALARHAKKAAPFALAALLALASSGPAATSLVSHVIEDRASQWHGAASSASPLLAMGPVPALVKRGNEVANFRLCGVDTSQPEVSKLVKVLTGKAVALRQKGAKAPTPWVGHEAPLNDLLEVLSSQSTAGSRQREGERPPIVLGHITARRIGAKISDVVSVTTLPEGFDPAIDGDPPFPRDFRVAEIAKVGVRFVDDGLGLADSAMVASLGGEPPEAEASFLEDDIRSHVGAFDRRLRQSAVAGSLQIVLATFLLAFVMGRSRGVRRGLPLLCGALLVGCGGGLYVGFSEASYGTVGYGSSVLYDILPQGEYLVLDTLSIWSLAPVLLAFAASLLGLVVGSRLRPSEG